MPYALNQIPFFEELKDSQNILLAGAGGGFDIFNGIPLYYSLKNQGKNVVLANFAFTWLDSTTSKSIFPFCYKIEARDMDLSGRNYFPEKYLKLWLNLQGETTSVYAFEKTGVNLLHKAYNFLIREHHIDTIILIDGGTDSLMFGDEEKLGTPAEDISSMAAVYRTGIKKQYLVSVGFGIDHFHGVSHFRFLENLTTIANDGGYLGMFQMLRDMPESQKFIDAVNFVNIQMQGKESIVANSIKSALENNYGNVHFSSRTQGSELWISPLMTIHWCFDLKKVIKRIKYYDLIKNVNSMGELNNILSRYRGELKEYRENKSIPL